MAASKSTPSAPAPRVLWKGAISFGLVHIPVALYSATQDSGIDFDWLDKRSMDPVGYKRTNKRTGREIACAISHAGTASAITDNNIANKVLICHGASQGRGVSTIRQPAGVRQPSTKSRPNAPISSREGRRV